MPVLSVLDLQSLNANSPLTKTASDGGYYYSLLGTRLGVNLASGVLPAFELDVNGTVRCSEIFVTSDAAAKADLEHAAPDWCGDALSRLPIYTFRRTDACAGPAQRRLGFLAEDVADVLPGAVQPGRYDGVDCTQLVAMLIGAMQHLQREVAALRDRHEAVPADACP